MGDTTMVTALEQLEALVRQAKANVRSQKIEAEVQRAADRLRVAEERAREAEMRLRETRSTRLKELEAAETERRRLDELVKEVAMLAASMPMITRDGGDLIDKARADNEQKRLQAQEELDTRTRTADEARRELKTARERYQDLRRELDALEPRSAAQFAAADALAREAERHLPAGQIQALAREIDDGATHFGTLDAKEQLAQLKIWIGRFRLLQDRLEVGELAEVTEEDRLLLERLHPRLVAISKEHLPGYIKAFRREFRTDWSEYIAEAQDELHQATEARRHRQEREQRRQTLIEAHQERRQHDREAGWQAFDELKAVLARFHLPDEGLDEFRDALGRVISGLGASEPEVLELVRPWREQIAGSSAFRALRRNLDKVVQQEEKDGELASLRDEHKDLIAATSGLKVLMLGGSVREPRRRALERLFEFEDLDWRPYEDARPALLDSVEQSIRNRGIHLVLILKDFVGHHVTDRLRPLCASQDLPCLLVEHGYGPSQVAEALRRGLLKPA